MCVLVCVCVCVYIAKLVVLYCLVYGGFCVSYLCVQHLYATAKRFPMSAPHQRGRGRGEGVPFRPLADPTSIPGHWAHTLFDITASVVVWQCFCNY